MDYSFTSKSHWMRGFDENKIHTRRKFYVWPLFFILSLQPPKKQFHSKFSSWKSYIISDGWSPWLKIADVTADAFVPRTKEIKIKNKNWKINWVYNWVNSCIFLLVFFFSYLGCQLFINWVYLLSLFFLSIIRLVEIIKPNPFNNQILWFFF